MDAKYPFYRHGNDPRLANDIRELIAAANATERDRLEARIEQRPRQGDRKRIGERCARHDYRSKSRAFEAAAPEIHESAARMIVIHTAEILYEFEFTTLVECSLYKVWEVFFYRESVSSAMGCNCV